MSTPRRIDPRIRALGKARIDVTRRAQNEQDWQRLWRQPRYPFAFDWGQGMKHCMQYVVDDFAAEVGFYIDVLGFPVSAFSPNYAQFTTPEEDLYFGVVAAPEGVLAAPPDTLRIQFSIRNLGKVITELEKRGVTFEIRPDADTHAVQYAVFRSPHGVGIELLGIPEPAQTSERPAPVRVQRKPEPEPEPESLPIPSLEDSLVAFWEDAEAEDEPGYASDNASLDQTATIAPPAGLENEVEDHAAPDEITYENIDDRLQDLDEPVYEDVEEPAEPAPVLPVKPRPTSVPRQPQPAPNLRSLDLPLRPGSLIRSRRNRSNGGARYPSMEDRDPRS